jgi:hypothetical protein
MVHCQNLTISVIPCRVRELPVLGAIPRKNSAYNGGALARASEEMCGRQGNTVGSPCGFHWGEVVAKRKGDT